MEALPTACALRGLVTFEVLGEKAMRLLLPINSLRNLALLTASSPLVGANRCPSILPSFFFNMIRKFCSEGDVQC